MKNCLKRLFVMLCWMLLFFGGPRFSGWVLYALENEDLFRQVQGEKAVLRDGAVIREGKDLHSQAVGIAWGNAPISILQREENWDFAENGYVRGYVYQADILASGEASREGKVVPTRNPMDNPAFACTHTTTMEVAADKVYAVACKDCLVSDHNDTWEGSAVRIAGILPAGAMAYVLADEEEEMVYVESGAVRGFVARSGLILGESARTRVEAAGEDSFARAEQLLPCHENRALYYTVTSVADRQTELRSALTEYALQYVGNPYEYGGDSLTGGIDCSGFVHAVYKHFGYSIPRTSDELRGAGEGVGTDLSDALPGDIICYDGHVALYIGEGDIVHASNSKPYPQGGIKVSKGNYRTIITIRRIIP